MYEYVKCTYIIFLNMSLNIFKRKKDLALLTIYKWLKTVNSYILFLFSTQFNKYTRKHRKEGERDPASMLKTLLTSPSENN